MPRLRDGVIKRGASWSYVIRVPDPATGMSRPKWVGGFENEADAKAARMKLAFVSDAASTSTAPHRLSQNTCQSGSMRMPLPLSRRRSLAIATTSIITSCPVLAICGCKPSALR